MVKVFATVADTASVAVIRTLKIPVGTVAPLIVPVFVFRLKPAGRDPAVTAQRYGDVPPVAAKVVR